MVRYVFASLGEYFSAGEVISGNNLTIDAAGLQSGSNGIYLDKILVEEILPLIMAMVLLHVYQFHQFRLKALLRLMQARRALVQLQQVRFRQSQSPWILVQFPDGRQSDSIDSQSSILLDAADARIFEWILKT